MVKPFGRAKELRCLLACGIALRACATPTPTPPVVVALPAVKPTPRGMPPVPLSPEAACAEGKALMVKAMLTSGFVDEAGFLRAKAVGLTEDKAATLLEALARACLDADEAGEAACKELGSDAKGFDDVLSMLLGVLGRSIPSSAPAGAPGPSMRLLVRLEARGLWRATAALREVLKRRTEESLGPCSPPTVSELAQASASLQGFVVVDGPSPRSPKSAWRVHAPTPSELADLAYFYAAIAEQVPEVGFFQEDHTSPPKAPDDPAVLERKRMASQMQTALLEGDLETHAKLADAYLASLGFPGPIRTREDGDVRWGGEGFSFVLRDAARSHELLGHDAKATELNRRARPETWATHWNHQRRAILRATERTTGCRAALADRLYVLDRDPWTGPSRLARAGFDVERLYRGALLTNNREERAILETAFALANRAGNGAGADALDRLDRLGTEDWVTRVRAIEGYADIAKKGALDRLFALAEGGAVASRARAIHTIGNLVQDRGYEPCNKSERRGWGVGSTERTVTSVMHTCEGSLDAREQSRVVARLGALAGSSEIVLRAAVAEALGKTGAAAARPVLVALKKDPSQAVGEICTSVDSGPSVCGPNFPVRRAAHAALAELADADRNRQEGKKQ
jgi:hypothetical protein